MLDNLGYTHNPATADGMSTGQGQSSGRAPKAMMKTSPASCCQFGSDKTWYVASSPVIGGLNQQSSCSSRCETHRNVTQNQRAHHLSVSDLGHLPARITSEYASVHILFIRSLSSANEEEIIAPSSCSAAKCTRKRRGVDRGPGLFASQRVVVLTEDALNYDSIK
jgi:hypothetical protein